MVSNILNKMYDLVNIEISHFEEKDITFDKKIYYDVPWSTLRKTFWVHDKIQVLDA